MKRLRDGDYVQVYHEVTDEGEHWYKFYDGEKRLDLDWGQTGHIPNGGDRFPHPRRDIDLHLDGIIGADNP